MHLTDLEPQFLRYDRRPDGIFMPHADSIQDAQGICFVCPKCFADNGHKRPSVHSVICWSRSAGVPEEVAPGPGRWRLVGAGYDDLSLMEEPGQSRSVLLLGGCGWHGFVTNGEIT